MSCATVCVLHGGGHWQGVASWKQSEDYAATVDLSRCESSAEAILRFSWPWAFFS